MFNNPATVKVVGLACIVIGLLCLTIGTAWSFAASGVFAVVGIGFRIEAAITAGMNSKD